MDVSPVEIRQFREPLALADGQDVGGVWQGGRTVTIHGTVYDVTRGKTMDRLEALAAVMLPVSGTFGFYDLTWYRAKEASPGYVLQTLSVLPNGLRVEFDRKRDGGLDANPLAIPWSVTMFAKNPAIT